MDDKWLQLKRLALLTKAKGLHEVQVLQLKCWPIVAAPHMTNWSSEVSFDNKSITFNWTKEKKAKAPSDFAERIRGLDRSVKEMLGQDWSIIVNINKKEHFKS